MPEADSLVPAATSALYTLPRPVQWIFGAPSARLSAFAWPTGCCFRPHTLDVNEIFPDRLWGGGQGREADAPSRR